MEYVIFSLFGLWVLITIGETFMIIFRGKDIRRLKEDNERLKSDNDYLNTIPGASQVLHKHIEKTEVKNEWEK